jgi:DNA-binding transcriptional MerR regulator
MGDKSPQAFRTIREVADWLGIEAHVLRFWESKFSQIRPVKRAGGRRYYRPADMKLIGGIKVLLHDQGLTIRGVQRRIQDDGVAEVSALSPPLDEELEAQAALTIEAEAEERDEALPATGFVDIEALAAPPEPEPAPGPPEAEAPAEPEPEEETAAEPEPEPVSEEPPTPEPEPEPETAPVSEEAPEPDPVPVAARQQHDDSAPDSPLSVLRAMLHAAVPLTVAQQAELRPILPRLEALATRLRSGHRAG